MARQTITARTPSAGSWQLVGSVWATGNAANDYQWSALPGDLLIVTNFAATSPTYTIVRPENRYGRGADYTSPTVGQFVVRAHRFLDLDGWAQPTDRMIYIDTTSDDLRFAVLRPPF